MLQTHRFGRERNWELQNANSSTGDIRKLILQAAAGLRKHLYECQALQMTGKEQMAWHSRGQQGKQAQTWKEEGWSKAGGHLGPLGSLFAINKEENQSLVSVTLSHTEQHRQCCHGSSWLQASLHSSKWRSKCWSDRHRRGKELGGAGLGGEWWTNPSYPFPGHEL